MRDNTEEVSNFIWWMGVSCFWLFLCKFKLFTNIYIGHHLFIMFINKLSSIVVLESSKLLITLLWNILGLGYFFFKHHRQLLSSVNPFMPATRACFGITHHSLCSTVTKSLGLSATSWHQGWVALSCRSLNPVAIAKLLESDKAHLLQRGCETGACAGGGHNARLLRYSWDMTCHGPGPNS